MADSIAGTYATLAGIEIVNEARTLAYLRNGLGPGSVNIYGDCGCPGLYDLLGCHPDEVVLDQYIDLPGTAGNYITTPDSVVSSITGDIDIRIETALDDWTPSAVKILVSKWFPGQQSYEFYVNTDGTLRFSTSTDGIATIVGISTVSTGLADGERKHVRVTFDVNDGSGNRVYKFYTSDNGIDWIQLGATVTVGGTTSIFNSTARTAIGAEDTPFGYLPGNVYSAEVRNGIDGTIVLSFNANDVLATSATTPNTVTSLTTGEVWTINGAGWTWGNGAYTYPDYPFVAPDNYVSPASDHAPWYSPDIPASADFLGFVVDEFEGLGSTFTRDVREAVGNGGILTRSRLGSRELVWRGYLFGATCCSVQYGLRWLAKTLARFNTNCRDCAGDDLELLVCCPDEEESADPFRLLKGVGLVEGPIILSERKTCSSGCSSGCGGSCILEVEFTLVASQPYFYSAPLPQYDCVLLSDGAQIATPAPEEPCPPFNCSDAFFETEEECLIPPLPPASIYTNLCAEATEAELNRVNYLTVPRSSWGFLEEVVPVITISNFGPVTAAGVKLSFYTTASDNPCGDLSENPPECDLLCDDLIITAIIGGSDFYIDGRTRKMSLICYNNNTAFPGERHTNGPWSWPVFSDFGFCMKIEFNDKTMDSLCVSLSLVPRTF